MENLKPLRKQKGLTMKQLGELVGVSESMIGYLESGERSPSFETLCTDIIYFSAIISCEISST